MKRIIIVIITTFFLFTMSGCSKNENTKPTMFYGETEKWVVIATTNNLFTFMYKGEVKDLKTDSSSKISFAYGTLLGSVTETQTLTDKAYFNQKYTVDLLSDDGDVNVQISYANVTDSVKLTAYTPYVTKN